MAKKLGIALLLLVFLLPAVPFALVFTDSGSRLLASLTRQYSPLVLGEVTGTLAGELHIASLRWAGDDASVAIYGLRLAIDHRCLWQSELCFSSVEIGSGTLQVADSDGTAKDITLPSLSLPMPLSIARLTANEFSITTGDTKYPLREIALSGRWRAHTVTLDQLKVDALDYGTLTLRNSRLVLNKDWPLSARLEVMAGEALPFEYLHGRPLILTLRGTPAALHGNFKSPDKPVLQGTLTVDLLSPELPFDTQFQLSSLENLALPITDALPGALSLQHLVSPAKLHINGDTKRQSIEFEGSAYTLPYGVLSAQLDAVHSQHELTIARLSLQDATGTSQLNAEGTVQFTDAPSWSLNLDIAALSLSPLHEQLTGNITGRAYTEGQLTANGWQAEVDAIDLVGNLNTLPAALTGRILFDNGALVGGSQLRGQINGASLALDTAGADSELLVRVNVEVDELHRWHASADGKLTAQATAKAGQYQMAGMLKHPGLGALQGSTATFSADYNSALEGQFNASFELSDALLGSVNLDTLQAQASGNQKTQSLRMTTAGDLAAALQVSGGGDANRWRGQMEPAVLRSNGFEWSLEEPVSINWADSGLLLASGSIAMTRLLAEDERADLHWDGVTVGAQFNNGLEISAAVEKNGSTPLRASLLLPADADQPLAGELLVSDFDLAALSGMLPTIGTLEGRWNGTLSLGGTRQAPDVSGLLTLGGGALSVTGNPTVLENINLRLQALGTSANLTGTGRVGGGEFDLEGAVTLQPKPALSLTFTGNRHAVVYPPSTELLLSQTLQLRITDSIMSISGDITVHSGEFRFEQLPEGGVSLSDDVVRIDIAQENAATQQELDIDVGITIESGFKITGTLLDSAVFGDLRVRRSSERPLQLFGSLNTAGGTVRAYDRVLAIKRGNVNFSGNPNNPLINLRAERRVSGSDVTAGLHVHGALADNLNLDVYSEPSMSQGDAMSYLIWGRSMDSGTNADGAVMALSVAGTVANRSSLVTTLNEVPGINDLRFGAEGEEEDAAATVSSFVGEQLYLSYGVGLYEPINVLTARLFLQARLWLEVVSRIESSVDLYYSFEID